MDRVSLGSLAFLVACRGVHDAFSVNWNGTQRGRCRGVAVCVEDSTAWQFSIAVLFFWLCVVLCGLFWSWSNVDCESLSIACK